MTARGTLFPLISRSLSLIPAFVLELGARKGSCTFPCLCKKKKAPHTAAITKKRMTTRTAATVPELFPSSSPCSDLSALFFVVLKMRINGSLLSFCYAFHYLLHVATCFIKKQLFSLSEKVVFIWVNLFNCNTKNPFLTFSFMYNFLIIFIH